MRKYADIIRAAGLGDIIYAEPIITACKNAGYEQVKFSCGHWRDVFGNHPGLVLETNDVADKISLDGSYEKYLFDTTWEKYDPKKSTIDCYLDWTGLTLKPEEKKPKLYIAPSETEWAKKLLGNYDWVVLDMGNGGVLREFYGIDSWRPVIEMLHANGLKVVEVRPENHENGHEIVDLDMRKHVSLREYISLVGSCKYYIGHSTSAMAIAYASGMRGVGIFRPRHCAQAILGEQEQILPVHRAHGDPFNAGEIIDLLKTII